MKTSLRSLLAFSFLLTCSALAHATHNRAGEIVVEQVKDANGDCIPNMVKVTVYTYTKTSSVAADRDTLTVCFGSPANPGEFCVAVPRSNGAGNPPQGIPQANDIKVNNYVVFHTFSGPGKYVISMTDPNRNGGILNVNPPGSENVQFHLQTFYTLYGGQFQGCNSTPQLLNPPVDYACIGQPFVHSTGSYDPDGDSLSYELIVPYQSAGIHVPNYTFPQNVGGNGACCLELDHVTGVLTWGKIDGSGQIFGAPMVQGEYNIAMIIISWRNGQPIDTTVRDMQILVLDCEENHAPVIKTEEEICVVAGDVVEFDVTASDPDAGDQLKLSAIGSPFIIQPSPADNLGNWHPDSVKYAKQPVLKTFRWQTACEHISDLAYNVVFKAVDDFFLQTIPGSTGLATSKTVRIKVVGPPPADVQAQPTSNRIEISWLKPYQCEAAADEYFFGFSVWRREGSNPFDPDCEPGLDGKGYVKIANTKAEVNGRYQYTDNDVERGRTYCYRILARFAKRTAAGQPYNFVESLPSDEICVQLSRDVPLITNVSVLETSTSSGRIEIKWVKPLANDLDTVLNHGPYRYVVERFRGFDATGSIETVATFTSPTYSQLTQNQFIDQANLNTQEFPYTYRIAFYVKNEQTLLGFSPTASSVFLTIAPTDNQNNLSWKAEVPWVNMTYTIFRKHQLLPQWDSIATVQDTFYADKGLLNGREYCYYVKTYGSYNLADIPSPLVNLSQEACAIPVDNVPPCPPVLAVRNICNVNIRCQETEELNNNLSWVNPMELCQETDDVVGYRIYYAAIEGNKFELIAEVNEAGDTTFLHTPERGIAGCYAVTALDTFNNESDFSPAICVDNCPNYELPNTFTPNGDGRNDQYTPFPFCFIEAVDLQVFNRWGELVFKTQDPNINWTGENLKGKDLPDGTYYYLCKVFEQRVSGTVASPEVLNGYIDLVR